MACEVHKRHQKVGVKYDCWDPKLTLNVRPYAPLCKKMNAPWDELTKTMSKIKTASIDVSDPEGQGAKIAKKLGKKKLLKTSGTTSLSPIAIISSPPTIFRSI